MNHIIRIFIFCVCLAVVSSCGKVKSKTKEAIGMTGEVVGEGTSEFVNGVSNGVDQTFECKVELSDELKSKGISIGKFLMPDSGGVKHTLSIFVSFDRDFSQTLTINVFDEKGNAYGRLMRSIDAKAGEGKFFDFVFDPRTNIESRSKFTIQ